VHRNKNQPIKVFLISLLFFLIGHCQVVLGAEESPMERLKRATNEITAALDQFCAVSEGKKASCEKQVMLVADRHFDWEEMARRSLARAWEERTAEEKKEFALLFRDLIKNAYVGKIDQYSGEEVVFEGESIKGDRAFVKTRVISPTRKLDIPVHYLLRKKGADWLVYDIVIEGVRLVYNYRAQFQDILQRSSYETLVQKLKETIAKEEG